MTNPCNHTQLCGLCGGHWDSGVFEVTSHKPICSFCLDRLEHPVRVPEDLLPNQSLVMRLKDLERRVALLENYLQYVSMPRTFPNPYPSLQATYKPPTPTLDNIIPY